MHKPPSGQRRTTWVISSRFACKFCLRLAVSVSPRDSSDAMLALTQRSSSGMLHLADKHVLYQAAILLAMLTRDGGPHHGMEREDQRTKLGTTGRIPILHQLFDPSQRALA